MKYINSFNMYKYVLFITMVVTVLASCCPKNELLVFSKDLPANECFKYIKEQSPLFREYLLGIKNLNETNKASEAISLLIKKGTFSHDFVLRLMTCSSTYQFSNYVDYFDNIFTNLMLLQKELVNIENQNKDLVRHYVEDLISDIEIISLSKRI